MPRLVRRPPKYALHKGTRQAIVSLEGRRIYLGPYASAASYARYQDILRQWLAGQGAPAAEAPSPPVANAGPEITPALLRQLRRGGRTLVIDDLVLVYHRHAHEYYRKHGRVTREATIIDDALRYLRQRHGATPVDEFGPVALDELRDGMIADLDWSRKHINKQIGRIVRMFKWGAEKELVAPHVPMALRALTGLKRGRSAARETRGVACVSDAIVEATLPHLPPVVAAMVRLQRLTGARPGEICSLRPCDVDRSGDVWLYMPAEHKTEHRDKLRVIAIGPLAQTVLSPFLLRSADAPCFSPADSEKSRRDLATAARTTPLSYGNRPGTNRVALPRRRPNDRYTADSYRRAVDRACRRHGIERWAPNRLRHTSATEIRKRFGIEAAQVVCGHERAEVTQVYAERNLELAIKVAREVG